MLMMTASTAYAQSQRASAAACPEGFQLNRGVCQAEPTLTCEPYGYPPHKIRVVDGQCELIENASPGCVEGYYDIFTDRCEINGTNDPSPNQEMHCGQYTELGWTLQRFDNRWQCIGYTYLPVFEQCTTGTLNTETGMCEIKPRKRAA